MIHVAVIYEEYVDLILRGEKRVELRLSRNRIAPFGVASRGDTLYIKQRGGPIRARARIARVEFHADLTPRKVHALRRSHNHLIRGAMDAWRTKENARYASLLWLGRVVETADAPPFRPFTGNAWQVLSSGAPLRSRA